MHIEKSSLVLVVVLFTFNIRVAFKNIMRKRTMYTTLTLKLRTLASQ